MPAIYLDNAATSFPKPPSVAEAMVRYLTEVGASINRGVYASAQDAGMTTLLLREALAQTHPLLLRRVIYRALCACLGQEKDIGGEHVRLLEGLFSLQVGRVLHLPCKGRAQRVYGGVRLYRAAFGAAGQGAAFAGEAGE